MAVVHDLLSKIPNPLQSKVGTGASSFGPLQSAEDARATNSNGSVAGIDKNWVFVGTSEIDGTRWNKSYPYQLMMVRQGQGSGNTGSEYQVEQTFTLPIAPSDLSIVTPFAINTTVTLGGIVEEHNGAPLRQISFSGTTGVTPLRGSAPIAGQASIFEGILGGTIAAIDRTIDSATSLIGLGPDKTNLLPEEMDEEDLKGTGYYQFRLLQRFLENYAALKKLKVNQNLRLALAIWKDQSVYLVTPQTFDVRRSASSPWEYNYSLQFKGWKRVVLGGVSAPAYSPFVPVTRDPNKFAFLMNKLQGARAVLQGSKDVLLAVNSDVERILFEPLREVVLSCKDVLGVAVTAADLPESIASTFKAAVLEAKTSFDQLGDDFRNLGVKSGKAEAGAGDTGDTKGALEGAENVNHIFDHPADNFELMDKIKPSELNLPPAIQRKITEERKRVRQLRRLDFEKTRDKFVEFAAQFADAVGAGNETFSATYGRQLVSATKTPTPDDFDVMFALNQTILEMNRLAASSAVDREQTTTMDALAGMASRSGIAFTVPTSKFAVPFPYGSTIEQLALTYLGDANRWHEIVALNGLRTPYVDEEGFDLILLTNGKDNQVTVSSAASLYVGQQVWLSSNSTSRTKRRITNIDQVSPGTVILTLDGDPDLDRYDVVAQAVLHAFLPDTVNSQMLIYIPSSLPPTEEDFRTKSIPGIDEFDRLIQVGGVDLLLTQKGDLAVTPDGDCRLSIGLANIIQQLKLVLTTPKGSLLHHPDYGLGIRPGASTADLDAKEMLSTLQTTLKGDPMFAGVSGVAISKAGPVLRVAMSVGIAGVNQTIPISVDIRR